MNWSAILLITERFGDDKRWDGSLNIGHALRVAARVDAWLDTTGPHDAVVRESAVTTALLHDIVEDTPTTIQEVRQLFGDTVADGVWRLTQEPPASKLAKLHDAPWWVVMVKAADRLDNLAGLSPGQRPRYVDEAEDLLEIARKRGVPLEAVSELARRVAELNARV